MSTTPPRDPRPPAAPPASEPAPEPAGTPTTPVERGGTIDIEGPTRGNEVDETGEESFPASDPPSFSPGTGGPPDDRSAPPPPRPGTRAPG